VDNDAEAAECSQMVLTLLCQVNSFGSAKLLGISPISLLLQNQFIHGDVLSATQIEYVYISHLFFHGLQIVN
jgi:hypothetical protein